MTPFLASYNLFADAGLKSFSAPEASPRRCQSPALPFAGFFSAVKSFRQSPSALTLGTLTIYTIISSYACKPLYLSSTNSRKYKKLLLFSFF